MVIGNNVKIEYAMGLSKWICISYLLVCLKYEHVSPYTKQSISPQMQLHLHLNVQLTSVDRRQRDPGATASSIIIIRTPNGGRCLPLCGPVNTPARTGYWPKCVWGRAGSSPLCRPPPRTASNQSPFEASRPPRRRQVHPWLVAQRL